MSSWDDSWKIGDINVRLSDGSLVVWEARGHVVFDTDGSLSGSIGVRPPGDSDTPGVELAAGSAELGEDDEDVRDLDSCEAWDMLDIPEVDLAREYSWAELAALYAEQQGEGAQLPDPVLARQDAVGRSADYERAVQSGLIESRRSVRRLLR